MRNVVPAVHREAVDEKYPPILNPDFPKMYAAGESIESLISQISSKDVESDPSQSRKWLKKVLEASRSSSRQEAEKIFPYVIKLHASNDLIVKKLASWLILQHAEHESLVLLAINTLLKDCQDSNPMVRGLALRTLSGLQQCSLAEYAIQPILYGLKDRSAYVRRTAVLASVKVFRVYPDIASTNGLIDLLYGMIRDSDPITVTNSLIALDEMLQKEGGVVVNKKIAHYILNKLSQFSEWNLVFLLDVVKKYRPKTDEEVLGIMNIVDPFLKHTNSAVVISALQYFLFLVRFMPHLRQEVYNRAKAQILHLLGAGNVELTYLLLAFLESIISEHQAGLQSHYRSFFCKYNEPLYVKQKKIHLLPQLVTQDNLTDILDELVMHGGDIIPELSCDAVKSIGQIAKDYPEFFTRVAEKLTGLFQLQVDHVTSHVLQVFQNMNFGGNATYLTQVMSAIPGCISHVRDIDGKCAILWLLGEYGEHLPDAPYILEEFIEAAESEESNPQLHVCLLSSTVKLFLKRPAECQEMLAQLMECCLQSSNNDLNERTLFYYQILKSGIPSAREIVCGGE